MPLGGWPNITDDNGDGTSGTVLNKSVFDTIRAAIESAVFSGVIPAADIIDEVITARGSALSLNARLSVTLAADGTFLPFSPQPSFKPGAATVADGTVGGGVNSQFAAVANSGGALTDLMSYTIQANHMNANGKFIRMTAGGTLANNANSKTINVVLGATTIFTLNNVLADLNWHIDCFIVRTSATTAKAMVRLEQGPKTDSPVTDNRLQFSTAVAITWSSANALKVQGQGVASSDIVQDFMFTEAGN